MLRSMQWLTGLSVVFFLLGIVVEYLLLISSHNPMQKLFLCCLNQLFASKKSPFNVSRFQFIRQFPYFWIIPTALNRTETVCWVTPNDTASSFCVWFWSSSSNASNFLSSNIFGYPEQGLSSTLKSPSLKRRNHSLHDLSVGCHHKLRQAFDASAALFFQLKQKIETFRKCRLVNTKFDISHTVKIKVFVWNSKRYWILLADV